MVWSRGRTCANAASVGGFGGEGVTGGEGRLPKIPALILRHAHIQWSNWLAAQWGKTSEVPFADLVGLWTSMENQEPWESTIPAGYTLTPEAA